MAYDNLETDALALTLNVLIFQGEKEWIAQGLEYHINAQGPSPRDALYQLQRLLAGQVFIRQALGLPLLTEALPRAPEVYWKQFNQAAWKKRPTGEITEWRLVVSEQEKQEQERQRLPETPMETLSPLPKVKEVRMAA